MVSRSFVPTSPEIRFRALLKTNLNTPVRLGARESVCVAGGGRGEWQWEGGEKGRDKGKQRGKTSHRSRSRKVHLGHKPQKHPPFIIFTI